MPKLNYPTAVLKVVADTYDPAGLLEDPFRIYDAAEVRIVEYRAPKGAWTASYPHTTTLKDIQEWMMQHELQVAETRFYKSRRAGSWRGEYVLKIGRAQDIVSAYDLAQLEQTQATTETYKQDW